MREFYTKLNRIRDFCAKNSYDGMYFSMRANFAWLTCGGNSTVERCSAFGVADIYVSSDEVVILTSEIERYRILAEELGSTIGCKLLSFPWHGNQKEEERNRLVAGKRVVSDVELPGMECRPKVIAELRYVLTPEEEARVRQNASDAAIDLERVARAITPGMTEFEVAAQLMSGSLRSGGDAPVVLVAFDERMTRYRHPVPTGRRLEKRALLACCSERNGLIVSATRIISFGQPDDEFLRRYEACAHVNATFVASTVTGAHGADIFAKALGVYEKFGFAQEWTKHHQGGALGYACRDYVVDANCKSVVLDNQLFSWNPSIAGTKIEDTILVKGSKQEVLTDTKQWPRSKFCIDGITVECPDILIR